MAEESPSKKSKVEAVHKGYGKLILFGEHFVVYKVPALVAAVSAENPAACT